MAVGLLLSVGGTPEPLIRSLQEHKPRAVCFFASQESIDLVSEIKKKAIGLDFKDYKVIIEDINDTTDCYEKALGCSSFLEKEGISPQDIVVDFTGGTKVMSAALTLLAVSRNYRLSYVGGGHRNKEGLGTVITGSEEVFAQANPWEILAIDDRRRAALMFNKFQFEAAIDSFSAAISKTQKPGLKRYLEILQELAKAYWAWDRFKHKEASPRLSKGFSQLRNYAAVSNDAEAHSLAGSVNDDLTFLEAFKQESGNFKEPCHYHLLDLLANAQRREAEGKYDDAVARLYRAFELLAQLRLKSAYSMEAGKAVANDIPATIRDDFCRKYSDLSLGKLKLPSQACYRLLNELGDKLGKRYLDQEKHLQGLLSARNSSILAHGFSPIGQDTFCQLWQMLLEFSDTDQAALPTFPQFPIPKT